MWNKKNWFSLLLVPKHGRGEMVLDGDDLHEVHLRVAVLVSSTEMDFSLVCGWDSIGGLRSTSHLFKDLVCLDATTTEIYLVLHFSELWFSFFFFLKKNYLARSHWSSWLHCRNCTFIDCSWYAPAIMQHAFSLSSKQTCSRG